MEITGPPNANYKPNYKTLYTKAGVCFSYHSLKRVTTLKNRIVKANLPNKPAFDSGTDAGRYINYSYVPQLDLTVLRARSKRNTG